MGSTAIRASARAHDVLKQMAKEDNVTLTEALDRVVEAERRRRFMAKATARYAELQATPKGRRTFQREEIEAFDDTLMDGLRDEPPYEIEDRGGTHGD